MTEIERLRRERDLYRDLLELGRRDDMVPFLEDALDLVVRIASARRGYIELFEDRDDEDGPRFLVAKGIFDEDVEEIRAALSRGIMAEAIATGRTITLESAQLHPDHSKRKSVRRNRTEAVLCAPIGTSPPIGVVYLQDRVTSGHFSEEDRRIVEDLAGSLAVIASRLLTCERRFERDDPTIPFRAQLHGKAAGIVGRSRTLARVLERIARAAPRNVGVIFGGPSGTGKTQLAHLLHESSPRARGPFVVANCADLTADKVDLHLFGVEKRTFTEVDEHPGKIELAEGGTLFLDEIGDLPLPSQAKLLTFLDSKEYSRLGSTRTRKADVRIVCATHFNLAQMVKEKAFRGDLYYRLCVVQVAVPSLAERREDIPLIAEALCDQAARELDCRRAPLSQEAHRALREHDWPGNIRELYQNIRAALVLVDESGGTGSIEPRHLFTERLDDDEALDGFGMHDATRRIKRQQVEKALEETAGNVKRAADLLGISRSYIYKLMDELGVGRKNRLSDDHLRKRD